MSQQEKQALTSLFGIIKNLTNEAGEKRRKAYRKSLYPDFATDTGHAQDLRHELQGQIKPISRLEYLTTVATDYLTEEIQLHELQEIINEARLQELILN